MLNIVHKFHNILHLSDTSKCDGVTLDDFVISDHTERSSLHVFPQEDLTPTDFWIWKEAIHRLCSGTTTLPTVLGGCVCPPHTPCEWFVSVDALRLFWIGDDPTILSFCTYIVRQGRGTCHGSKYSWVSNKIGLHPGMHYASVLKFEATCAIMHSKTPICLPAAPLSTMATAACGRTSCMTGTESGFGMDSAAILCVLHTTGSKWQKNHPTYVWQG